MDFDPLRALDALYGRMNHRRGAPNNYPDEGTPTGSLCEGCGGPLRWVYGYKRRRPRPRCLVCDPLITAKE